MAKRFKKGDTAYVPVTIDEVEHKDKWYDYVVKTPAYDGVKAEFPFCVKDEEVKTADEIADDVNPPRPNIDWQAKYNEYKENADRRIKALEEERDEWKKVATNNAAFYNEANRTASEAAEANDELKAKIAELRAENDKLKSDCNDWKDTADERLVAVQVVAAERDNLKAENDNLRTQVGGYTVDIQDLTSDVNFYKKDRDGWLNTAQGNAKLAEALQDENKKLKDRVKYLEAERNAKPTIHVLTNDGHVYAFTATKKPKVKYCAEHDILTIEDGEEAIAGFVRGDKPGNLSAWWTW